MVRDRVPEAGGKGSLGGVPAAQLTVHAGKRRCRPTTDFCALFLGDCARRPAASKGTARNPTPRRARGQRPGGRGGAQRLAPGEPGGSASTGWELHDGARCGTVCPGDLPDRAATPGPGGATHCGRSGAGRDEASDGDTGPAGGRAAGGPASLEPPRVEQPPPRPQPQPFAGPRPAERSAERTNFPAESPKFAHNARDSGRRPPARPPGQPAPRSRGGRGGTNPRSQRMNGRRGALGTRGPGPTPFPAGRRPPARVGRAGAASRDRSRDELEVRRPPPRWDRPDTAQGAAGGGRAWRANFRVAGGSYLAPRRPRGPRATGPGVRARPGGAAAAAAARATCGRQATS